MSTNGINMTLRPSAIKKFLNRKAYCHRYTVLNVTYEIYTVTKFSPLRRWCYVSSASSGYNIYEPSALRS